MLGEEEREKRVIEKELQRLGEETAGIVRMTGKLATDRMAELQDRVAVLERQFRDVCDQLAESVARRWTRRACGKRSGSVMASWPR